MEDSKPADGASDRDKKMQGSFENYTDKSESKEKKDDDKDEKDDKPKNLFDFLKEDKVEDAPKEATLDSFLADDKQPDEAEAVPEVAEAAEVVPLETLSESESHQVVEQYAEARAEDLQEDLEAAEPDSVEEAVALANAAFIEAVQENEPTTDEELDATLADTINDLQLQAPEAAVEDEDEEDPTVVTAAATPPTPPVPPAQNVTIPGGRHPGLPPLPPEAPEGTTTETVYVTEDWRARRRRAGQLLLVGGVGYLLGRRRGRIKTEARLLPVQEKLEKEVKTLHEKVAEREDKIRRLAAEKVMQEPETARPQLIERIQERVEKRKEVAAEKPVETVEEAPRRVETFGKFVLPEKEVVTPIEAPAQRLETMTMPELLAMAALIEKDGVSVKEMYDNGRLDAVGLRRVIKEYLEGNRLDRVLADNLKELESFEGQPLVQQAQHNQAGAEQSNAVMGAAAPHFDQYRPGPPTPMAPVQPMADTPKKRAEKTLAEHNTAIMIGLLGVVFILFAIIIFG